MNHQVVFRRLLQGLVFGLLVYILLILVGDIRQIGEEVRQFRWSLFPAVLALTLSNYILRFFKWHYYLKVVGVERISLVESARLFVAGFPLAVTPGKVGEALKAVWLKQVTGLPVGRGVAVVLAERISDGLAVLLLSTLGVIAYPQYWRAFAVVLAALISILVISQIRPLALAILSFSARLPLIHRFTEPLQEFYEGSYSLFKPSTTLIAVSIGFVSWLGEGIGMYLILIGLGVPAGWENASLAVFTLSFSTVIGAASALPGGLGAAEASITAMLSLLVGMSREAASTATLLIRFATLWFGVFLGLSVWLISKNFLGLADTPAATKDVDERHAAG